MISELSVQAAHIYTMSNTFSVDTLGPFKRGKIRRVLNIKDANCTIYTNMSYLIRRVLAKPRLILDEMCRLYGKFASYLRRVLCKRRLIFSRINGPIVNDEFLSRFHNHPQNEKLLLNTCAFSNWKLCWPRVMNTSSMFSACKHVIISIQ